MVKELLESLGYNLRDKLKSPFWGAFIVSWLILNWRVWYITIFVDSNLLLEEKGLLKMDYIYYLYRDELVLDFLSLIISPFLSAWFFVFVFPWITFKFYEKSLEMENRNKIVKNKKDEEYFKVVGKTLEAERNIVKEKAAIKEEKKKIEKSQEEIWDNDYEIFKNTNFFRLTYQLKDIIYQKGGNTWNYNGNTRQNFIDSDFKAYLDTNRLVDLKIEQGGYEKAFLTEKGKYFMKKYLEENG